MNYPNLALMRQYGTAGVFREKTAGATPFAARVAAAVFSGQMVSAAGHAMDLQRAEAHQLNEQFRLLEQRRLAPAVENLQHTRAPMFVNAESDLPVGWDEGMVRLASIAHGVGSDMAKLAIGIPAAAPKAAAPIAAAAAKPAGSLMQGLLGNHWKAKALGYGALLGGGYMALKGTNSTLGAMSRPAPPQNWGAGNQIPMGVNQYGYPQGGTPLMG